MKAGRRDRSPRRTFLPRWHPDFHCWGFASLEHRMLIWTRMNSPEARIVNPGGRLRSCDARSSSRVSLVSLAQNHVQPKVAIINISLMTQRAIYAIRRCQVEDPLDSRYGPHKSFGRHSCAVVTLLAVCGSSKGAQSLVLRPSRLARHVAFVFETRKHADCAIKRPFGGGC
jgi:hypothetical protein